MIPMLLRVSVRSDKSSFKLFLPLILIYLLLFIAQLLSLISYMVLLAIPKRTVTARSYLMIIVRLPVLLTAAKGIAVSVHSNDSDIQFSIK